MRAMLSHTPGGPETLTLSEIPSPSVGPGEARIRVMAAGANFPDTLIIQDRYQIRPPRPFAPGGEVAGVIEAAGAESGFAPGDRVLALTVHGGFAEEISAPAAAIRKIPTMMPFDEAACFLFTYGTSHYALRERAALTSGETLLVLGAAGGVGSAAVELGKAMGATVIAAVSSKEKAAFCRDLGADAAVIYPRDMDRPAQKAFADAIKAEAGAGGVDVVFDAVGGPYAEPALRALGWEGRFLVVGFPAGVPQIPLNLPLLKSCQIIGVFWGAALQRDPERHAAYAAELFEFYEAGRIRPRISARFPLAEAGEALKLLEARAVLGKIVITMEPSS